MAKSEQILTMSDKAQIFYYKHTPENEVKSIIIIVHGMAEHAQRYDEFARFLNRNAYVVYAHDQRGHGKTADHSNQRGFFSENEGWKKVTNDLAELIEIAQKEYPNKPLFLLGHSMGSFITRTYIAENSDKISGVLLSGTTGSAGLLGKVGIALTTLIMMFKKKNSPSPLMNKLSFGSFNKGFKPNRTDFDWLSRDTVQVDKYVNDPYCGNIFSVGFFNDMMKGLEFVNKIENTQKIRKDLPIYLFSGSKDPVSKNGKQVNEVFEMFKKAGLTHISIKLYPEGRHEMLNEINKNEVYDDVLNCLKNT
jgi:alpha-beta hydrolase superfamily lysophospholipase